MTPVPQVLAQSQQLNYSELATKINALINEYDFNGVISISKGSTQIYSKAVGFSDIENSKEIEIEDQFVIGSISKQITAVLILKEYENGTIRLTDAIGKYLTGIDPSWKNKVTIHHLLTHTHGIKRVNEPLAFEPGSQFQYSQLGYELLAQILQNITGKAFKTIAQDTFDLYELNNTFHPDSQKHRRLVKGYQENGAGELIFAANSLRNYAAAGSFVSNAEDLIRWNTLLHSNKLVSQKTLDLMKERYATRIHPIFESVEYGYGLLFKIGEEEIQIGTLGYAPGFVSASYYHPQTHVNLVVLQNTARDLQDFKKTFKVHTEVMALVKKLH